MDNFSLESIIVLHETCGLQLVVEDGHVTAAYVGEEEN